MSLSRYTPQHVIRDMNVVTFGSSPYRFTFTFDGPVTSIKLQGNVRCTSGTPTPQYQLWESLDGVNWVEKSTGWTDFAVMSTVTVSGLGYYQLRIQDSGGATGCIYNMVALGT